jgi:thiamine biosynthesis lipoprotein
VEGGIINASGDLITWGRRANGDDWKIGIPDPQASDNIILWLPFKEKAIATSGDYEKYFTNNGQRYSHIVNPKTGLPVVGSASVSVISDSAELSDALATAVSVLGLDVGMNLINQLDGIECVFIDNNRKLHFSSGLQTYAY